MADCKNMTSWTAGRAVRSLAAMVKSRRERSSDPRHPLQATTSSEDARASRMPFSTRRRRPTTLGGRVTRPPCRASSAGAELARHRGGVLEGPVSPARWPASGSGLFLMDERLRSTGDAADRAERTVSDRRENPRAHTKGLRRQVRAARLGQSLAALSLTDSRRWTERIHQRMRSEQPWQWTKFGHLPGGSPPNEGGRDKRGHGPSAVGGPPARPASCSASISQHKPPSGSPRERADAAVLNLILDSVGMGVDLTALDAWHDRAS